MDPILARYEESGWTGSIAVLGNTLCGQQPACQSAFALDTAEVLRSCPAGWHATAVYYA